MFRSHRFLFLAGIVSLTSCNNTGDRQYPSPKNGQTLVFNKENQENRLAWIESMHKAPPGVDWRSIELDNLRRKVASLQSAKSNAKNGQSEDFANGALSGEWIERGPSNQAGSIKATLYDPQDNRVFYISSGGTLFKTELDGSSTVVINQETQFNDDYLKHIKVDQGRRLISKIGHEPYFSDDGGVSWVKSDGIDITDKTFGRTDLETYADGRVILALSKPDYWADFALYRSIDKGASFQKIREFTTFNDDDLELYMPQNGNIIYLAERVDDTVQISQYDAISGSFSMLIDHIDVTYESSLVINPCAVKLSNGSIRHYFYSSERKVIYTDDDGVNIIESGTMPVLPWGLFYALPSNPDFILMGEVEAYSSVNKGRTWIKYNDWGDYYENIKYNLHADIMSINEFTTNDGKEIVLIGHHGGLSRSMGALASFENITLDGISTAQYYDVRTDPFNSSIIYAGSQDQGFQRSSGQVGDGIHQFDQLISGDYGKIAFTRNKQSMWTIYPGGDVTYFANAQKSKRPNNWYTISSENESVWLPPLIAGPNPDKNEVFVAGGDMNGGSGTHVMRLSFENNQINVDQFVFDFNPASNGKITALAISRVDNTRFYVGTEDGAIFYTTDSGATWNRSINNIPNGHYLYGAAILPSKISPDVVYVGGRGYDNPAVLISEDGGKNFDAISQGLPRTTVFDLDMSPDGRLVFAATEAGPYVYVAEDRQWYDINGVNAPRQAYWSVEYIEDEDIVRFGTYGRGVWDFNITQNSVARNSRREISGEFKVYPNPSSDGKFQMEVHLAEILVDGEYSIFNSIGELLLTRAVISAEKLSLNVDISNAPAGVYYLSLRNKTSQKTLPLYKQ